MLSPKIQQMERSICPTIKRFAETKYSSHPFENKMMIQAWKTKTYSNPYANYINTPFKAYKQQFQKECQEMKHF
jgi:hypothetical protein